MAKIKQGTPEWHEQRANRITGTRICKAAKECIWTKGDQWESLGRDMYREANKLTQDPFNQFAMYAMKHGTDSEPLALATLSEMGYKITQPSFVIHPKHNWMGISPDGIIVQGRDGKVSAVEVKCPQGKPCTNVKEQKRNYWHQMQMAMECMDIDEMLFFQWYSNDEHYQEWIERDRSWAETYIPKAEDFMVWYNEKRIDPNYIERWNQEKEEPGINYKAVDDEDDTSELASVLKELKELKDKISILDERKKILSAVLIAKHGGAFSTSQVKCHMTQARGRINYARLVKDQEIPVDVMESYRSEGDSRVYTKLLEE
jgi:putative phage-type endonuclease